MRPELGFCSIFFFFFSRSWSKLCQNRLNSTTTVNAAQNSQSAMDVCNKIQKKRRKNTPQSTIINLTMAKITLRVIYREVWSITLLIETTGTLSFVIQMKWVSGGERKKCNVTIIIVHYSIFFFHQKSNNLLKMEVKLLHGIQVKSFWRVKIHVWI